MQLDVQWFIYALVSNQITTVEQSVALYQSLGQQADLGTFAQTVLNDLTQGLPEDQINATLEQIQQVVEFAVNQAQSGTVPDIFANGVPGMAAPAPAPTAAPAPAAAPDKAPEGVVDDGPRFGSVLPQIDVNTDFFTQVANSISAEEVKQMPELNDVMKLNDQQVVRRVIHLLLHLRYIGASDLHFSAAAPIFMRRKLDLTRFNDHPLTPDEASRYIMIMLNVQQREAFRKSLDMNFALEFAGSRFRGCVMMQKDGMAASFRLVPNKIKTLEELGFMPHDCVTIRRLLDYHNGLILVTGPISSGKTTTLASMVDILNNKRQDHVITVEDPIEIIQQSKNCVVTQREIGTDTDSYRAALKGALREDPDIIVIGEMHDLETIENAITASETGHLVIGTLHTSDAANTLNRVLDVFPPGQQAQIRTMTAGSLRGIICQRLVHALNGDLTIGYEILVNSTAVSNNIADGKIHQLKASMEIGQKQGMCTFDQCLLAKYEADLVSYEEALSWMRDASVIAQIKRSYAIRQAKSLSGKGKK